MKPTLRYWDCRGRAQPLRHVLVDRGVDFVDDQVPGADASLWAAMKLDPAKSGPFGTMPILHWGRELVAETSVIADFLTEQLELHRGLSRSAIQRSRMVRSATAELGGSFSGFVIHGAGTSPSADAATLARLRLPWLLDGLRRVAALVPGDTPFFGGDEPDLADFSTLEMVDSLVVICGPAGTEFVRGLPAVRGLYERARLRPRMLALAETGALAERFTGRLDEASVVEELRGVDWSGSFA